MLVISTFLINAVLNFALGLLIARFLGPSDFGQYAIASSLAIVLNLLFLEWIRFSATRFYSGRSREENPALRLTLDKLFVVSSFAIILVCATGLLLGFSLGLAASLAAFAPAMAICNGLFDYNAALVRARFEERNYSLLVILKNAFSFALMVGGAWWFQSPTMVMGGFVLSILATMLISRKRLVDPAVPGTKPDWAQAREFARYGLPMVVAIMVFFIIPLWNRTTIAGTSGFSNSGQFSLAYDTATKIIQTIGAAIDILLFQIALKKEDREGQEEARQQLITNMGIALAMISAMTFGYWLVLPSLEASLVPEAFRGSFSQITIVLLPGIASYVLLQVAVSPIFQLMRKTWPLIIASTAALILNLALTWNLGKEATILEYARAQSFAYAAALVLAFLLAVRELKVLPRLRDVLGAALATAAMIAAVWPLRSLAPGLTNLLLSALAGGLAFGAIAFLLNLAGCREWIRRIVGPDKT